MSIVGRCMSMCPLKERTLRLRVGDVPAFEDATRPDATFIKAYSRSAAGSSVDPDDVRPLAVLQATTMHLLTDTLPRGVADSYLYITDRLRAVRKDGAIQRACGYDYAALILSHARFHIVCSYLLCGIGAAVGALSMNSEDGDDDVASTGYHPAVNDKMLAQALSEAARALPVASEGMTPAQRALQEEVAAYCALAFLMDPSGGRAHTHAAAAYACQHDMTTPTLPRALALCRAFWRCSGFGALSGNAHLPGDACAFLREVAALQAATGAGLEGAHSAILRCLVHRYMPLARVSVLASINDAYPSRLPLPVAFIADVLSYADAPGGVNESTGCVPAWFSASRICTQLRLRVVRRDDVGTEVAVTAPELMALARSTEQAQHVAASLYVHTDKSAVVDARAVRTDVRVAIALTPTREDGWSGVADIEAFLTTALVQLAAVA